ncbi:DUF2505 domain-containing protein [Actinomycetospora sp. TBRC 11914]|uniref:DUF2505 domain-containing protein n=1 Tax=Actinomycetospora sp. TBRC 11914 TaxID=2729387 RepID=UPI00145CA8C7|nr:DUF2505 domain-containing protein [Actinomycetospora sp. TBRC 11914]NMO93950.1 DUF2505 domain-containing protein [Actinomycetospora sp. TBRC 11914]
MTTRLRASRDYPHDVADFSVALADPDFHRARLDAGGGGEVERHRTTGTPQDGTVEVVVRQPVPTGQIPPAIGRLLTGGLVLRRTERWRLGPRRCDGEVEVAVPRAPVRAEGTMSVAAAAGSGCRLAVDVAVTVTIPWAGALVEGAVADGVRQLTRVEHDNITRWLDAHTDRES